VPRSLRRAERTIGLVALGANLAPRFLPATGRFAVNLAAAAASVGIARVEGAEWSDLGLGPGTLRPGLQWGLGAGGVAALGVAVAARTPRLGDHFRDERVGNHDRRRARYELAARIPLETALAEEVVFRGALLGLALRQRSTVAAVATSSVLFGLWHVLPTWTGHDGSAIGSAMGPHRSARVGAVAAAVAATTAAGATFATLRLRSGSVVAPVLAHAALNMASFAATRATHARLDPSTRTEATTR
jgi:membrane protease YdiL (CAAX protease family)